MENGEFDDFQDLVGRVLGNRYVLEEFIDHGGFGSVYKGTDKRLEQQVAIKVGRSSREFKKEARLAASVKHPNIVNVIDFGSDKGWAYLVMDLLRGETLDKLFERQGRTLSPDQLRKFVNEVGDALANAHDVQLIHRDLKPQNIILSESFRRSGTTAQQSRFVLFDFGIAARLDTEGTQRNRTLDGAGTIEYMAPELFRKDPQATPQSDIYAFGVILYQMMTGRVPFPQEDGSLMARGACMAAIDKAPPPRFYDVCTDCVYPIAMEELVIECLHKDPSRRPENIADVRQKFIDISDIMLKPVLPVIEPSLAPMETRFNPVTLQPTDFGDDVRTTVEQLPVKQPVEIAPRRSASPMWIVFPFFLLLAGTLSAFLWVVSQRTDTSEPSKPNPLSPAIEIESPTSAYLATGGHCKFNVECSSLPEGATFTVVPKSLAEAKIHVNAVKSPQKPSSWELRISADESTEPNLYTLLIPTKIQEGATLLHEQTVAVDMRVIWLPHDFESIEEERVVSVDGKFYYEHVRTVVGTLHSEFVLVSAPRCFGDPDSFYMMKDKVSRELFNEFLKQPQSPFSDARRKEILTCWSELGGSMSWPVTGTRAAEAHDFAEWVGGKLPTRRQWKRAAGYDYYRQLQKCTPPHDWKPDIWKRGPFHEPWAVGDSGIALADYAEVGTSSRDVSYYRCRDMAGNGTEFLRDLLGDAQLPVLPGAALNDLRIFLQGKAIGSTFPLLFEDFDNPFKESLHEYTEADPNSSFRVVIER